MDPLLIDLRSPDDTLEDENMCWHIDKKNHIMAGIEGNDEIDFKLLRLPQNESTPPILEKITQHSSLNIDPLFSISPLDSPLSSPHHGSCLTPRQLMTPSCSPLPRVRDMQRQTHLPSSPLAVPRKKE
eukprot:TRINITY_DN17923_c0_g1_i1.p1 TRINITY_DN17923_c0_g1~~TRINITY_DN17923_c0_g1_i1.p1  ORF type:complete len:142 (+),score=30.49 TRINITY_DN17923_c0_g1_i1:44-427(+)